MPWILFSLGLFDRQLRVNREESEKTILWALEILTDHNYRYLLDHPGTPKLYNSGVKYAYPDQMTQSRLPEARIGDLAVLLKKWGADEETVEIIVAILKGVEIFRDIPKVLQKGAVDCFPLSQKIIVRSKSTGLYELVAIGDLRFLYSAYEALSYNFSTCEYEFKDIIGFVDKGVQAVSKARLSNGTDLVSTDSHQFWSLEGQKQYKKLAAYRLGTRTMGEYVETYADWKGGKLSDGQRGRRSRIIQASRVPTLNAVRATPAEAYLAGVYAAEGYLGGGSGTRPWIAQHKPRVRAKIEQALDAAGVASTYLPGGRYGGTAGSGAAYYLRGVLKDTPLLQMMQGQGTDSFDKRLPQNFLSGDAETISRMLEGHADGDAWCPANGAYKRPNIDSIYATSSDELVEQLRFGLLALGRPFYLKHGGSGKAPIWRLHEYNDKATKLRSREELLAEDLPGLRFGTVRNAVPFGKAHVGCVEVEGNHNFFLADGTLVKNCDNLAAFRCAELRVAGVKAQPMITWRETGQGTTYHALVRWPDGTSEDPSRILGLGQPHEGEEERRKNRERFQTFVDTAKALYLTGGDAAALGRQIDLMGLVGVSW